LSFAAPGFSLELNQILETTDLKLIGWWLNLSEAGAQR
jgi:hypothetical protein